MATSQTKRIAPSQMQADLDSIAAVQALGSYAPANPTYAPAQVAEQVTAVRAAQEKERAAQAALNSARDDAVAAEWKFHDFTLTVKEQVIAQFGKNSNEVQTLGLKKKSEYKAHARKAKVA